MRIISRRKLREFWELEPRSELPLLAWYKAVEGFEWSSFADVKASYGVRADLAGRYVVFDIGGNKWRLMTSIHYNTRRVYVRAVWTHAEYDRWNAKGRPSIED